MGGTERRGEVNWEGKQGGALSLGGGQVAVTWGHGRWCLKPNCGQLKVYVKRAPWNQIGPSRYAYV